MSRRTGSPRILLLLLLLSLSVAGAYALPDVRVRAVLGSSTVQVGGNAELQIQVTGSDHPKRPRFPSLDGASVTYEGGSENDSTQITVVNGNQSTVVNKGYVFTYMIRPDRTGTLSIPPLAVSVAGGIYRTRPVSLSVSKAARTTAFLLRLELDKHRLFVGEPDVMTVKWYISENVANVSFHLPMLGSPAFDVRVLSPSAKGGGHVQLPLGTRRVTATRSAAVVQGRSYTLIRFREVLVPKRPGRFSFTDSSVELTTQPSAGAFFNSFFGGNSSPRDYVIPANPVNLTVRPLPMAGRPSNFTGLVGQFSLQASASPATVNVGDPISLKIRLSGGADIASAAIPSLATMAGFKGHFKLPQGRPSGTVTGTTKTFSQTIRATSDRVHMIPQIKIPYFDPATGKYAMLRSAAMKLVVRPTHILTAKDLQGAPAPSTSAASSAPTAASAGIDYNYEGRDVLRHGTFSSVAALAQPLPATAAGIPLLAFLGLLATRFIVRRRRRRGEDAREAERELRRLCESGAGEEGRLPVIFSALRAYLSRRLGVGNLSGDYETYRPHLPTPDLEQRVRELFLLYDRHRYSGAAAVEIAEGTQQLARGCLQVVALLNGGGAK